MIRSCVADMMRTVGLVSVLVARAASAVGTRAAPLDLPVRGLYHWIHSTGDAERSLSFYREVFGIELARSPVAGVASANAEPEPIRPVSQAGSDALVWALTNTHGSRFRTVFMRAANTPFGLELSEFFDVPRSDRHANPWDPGASKLIFAVRDLNAVVARLTTRRTPVVTIGGVALNTPNGRAILVRDPDGYLVEVRQPSSAAVTAAKEPGDVIETAVGITVVPATSRGAHDVEQAVRTRSHCRVGRGAGGPAAAGIRHTPGVVVSAAAGAA